MRSKLRSLLPVACVLLLCGLVLAWLVHGIYGGFRALVIEQAGVQMLSAASDAAHYLDHFVEDRALALQRALGNPLLQAEPGDGSAAPLVRQLFEDLMSHHGGIVSLELLDRDLRPLLRLSEGPESAYGADGRDLLAAALAEGRPRSGRTLVWEAGRPFLQVAVPAPQDAENSPVGAARMLLRLDEVLDRFIAPLNDDKGGTSWAVAWDGTIAWHPASRKIGQPLLSQFDERESGLDMDEIGAVLQAMRAGEQGVGVYRFASWRPGGGSTQKIAGYAPARSAPLTVAVAVEYGQIALPIHRYALRVGTLGLIILAVILGGGLLYLRSSRRARRLQGALLSQLNHVLAVGPVAVYYLRRGAAGELEPVFMSSSLQQMFGYRREDWRRGPEWWMEHIHPEDLASTRRAWAELFETGQIEHQFRFRHSDGRYLWVRDVARLLRGPGGEIEELVGSWQDVTARRDAQERLRLAERLFENAVEGAFVADANWRMLRVNTALTRITGYSAAEIVDRGIQARWRKDQEPGFERRVKAALAERGSWTGRIRLRRKDGRVLPARMSVSTVIDEQDRITHYTGLITDLSAQHELERKVMRLSHYDPVTGLPNRALMMERLAQALNAAAHRGERLAVLYVDLDRFKQINESLGRKAGDQILNGVATRLQYGLEAGAVLTRTDGDQFVVILTAVRDAEHAGRQAAEACRLIGEPLPLVDLELELSVSIGISLYPDDAEDAQTLLHNAEAAMYHVKAGGGGAYQFFTDDLNERALRRLKLIQALREAVPREQLRLAYQPQMDLASGRLVGVEALLRWEHPELGLVPPMEFVPLAEQSGLIVGIGEWVLREACRQAVKWQAGGPLRVGVNLSLRQFQAGTLTQTVARVLEETGLAPGLLELEITESLAMADPEATSRTLDALRGLGVRLALDDFGTGYSSLAHLQRLSLDTLKIDRAFIEHLETRQDDRVLITTIVSLAHTLGLTVIAEGVETFGQLEILREQGCDEIQGYYLSRPLWPQDFGPWLEQYRRRLRADVADLELP